MFPLRQKIQKGYRFGQYTYYGRKHAGTDYQATYDDFFIPFNGYVKSGWGPEGGNFLELTRDNGDVITLRHLSKNLFKTGYRLEGEYAGVTGNTGMFTTTPHLHIEVKKNGILIDPETYNWNRVKRVKLVQNGSPWNSMADKFTDILKRLTDASGGRLSINIDVDYVNLVTPFTTQGYPDGYVGADLSWYQQNILPHKGNYDVVCYLDNHYPSLGKTFGWHTGAGQLQVYTNETDTITFPSYGTVNYFVHVFIHEFCHYLKENQPPDNTHQFFNDSQLPEGQFDFKGFCQTLNYDL